MKRTVLVAALLLIAAGCASQAEHIETQSSAAPVVLSKQLPIGLDSVPYTITAVRAFRTDRVGIDLTFDDDCGGRPVSLHASRQFDQADRTVRMVIVRDRFVHKCDADSMIEGVSHRYVFDLSSVRRSAGFTGRMSCGVIRSGWSLPVIECEFSGPAQKA